ncbi:protein phosphatase 2C domain-containing protein [Streptosporangium sp. NPDC051023]|uniref:protein phosphatase 2C domain-containing protein n=1 Tax=Streptosporangium sp. NPDC051023 TaxID=3155410 RepID=UPI00344B1F0B
MALIGSRLLVVLDGLTERTASGCIHGVGWYVNRLASSVVEHADQSPEQALESAISRTAELHRDTCDLSHPGTPAAAIGIVQFQENRIRYLVLGDVTIIVDVNDSEHVISDDRLGKVNTALLREVNGLTNDSPDKEVALVRMKHAELAVRNKVGGYWVAASDPAVARQAMAGEFDLANIRRVAILTDGAARVVDLFGVYEWRDVMTTLSTEGPHELIRQVRAIEQSDPVGKRWPRNKVSDDATVIYCDTGQT